MGVVLLFTPTPTFPCHSTHPISRDWLLVQRAEWSLLVEEWLQALLAEEVAALCLHGVPHGQPTLWALVPREKMVNKLALVA